MIEKRRTVSNRNDGSTPRPTPFLNRYLIDGAQQLKSQRRKGSSRIGSLSLSVIN
jgi:hypothetical protein